MHGRKRSFLKDVVVKTRVVQLPQCLFNQIHREMRHMQE
jgi:hypothetical protein